MFGICRKKIPSLEQLAGVYSARGSDSEIGHDAESYLKPKTSAQITDAIIEHFNKQPASLSGRTQLLSLRNFISQQDSLGEHFEVVRLLVSVIKLLPVESYFDGSSDSRSSARILSKFGVILSEQAACEASRLKADFKYEIRPRDGYRMQITEVPEFCLNRTREIAIMLSGLSKELNPDLGQILGIKSHKLRAQAQKISELADSMNLMLERRKRDIRSYCVAVS